MKTEISKYRMLLYKIAAIDPEMMRASGVRLSDEKLKKMAIANMFRWIPSLSKRKPKSPKAQNPKKIKKLNTKERITNLEEEIEGLRHNFWMEMSLLKRHIISTSFMKEFAKGLSIKPDGTIIYKSETEKLQEEYYSRKRAIEEAKASGQPISFMEGITICDGKEFGQFGGSDRRRSQKRYPPQYYEAQVRTLFGEIKTESK